MPDSPNKPTDSFDAAALGPIAQFDQVGILKAENVVWLSTLTTKDFRGQWAVVHVESGWLVLSRGDMIMRIPDTDVRVLIKYSLDSMFDYMGTLSDGKGTGGGKGKEDSNQSGTKTGQAKQGS